MAQNIPDIIFKATCSVLMLTLSPCAVFISIHFIQTLHTTKNTIETIGNNVPKISQHACDTLKNTNDTLKNANDTLKNADDTLKSAKKTLDNMKIDPLSLNVDLKLRK